MDPTLVDGDNIIVNKSIIGARMFNIFAANKGEDIEIRRLWGVRKPKHNDVLVFNNPYPYKNNIISLSMEQYAVKRCIALPGDTLEIKNGFFKIRGVDEPLGNQAAQAALTAMDKNNLDTSLLKTYPYIDSLHWDIKDFGPLYVPQKGASIVMTPLNTALYRNLIEWEQKAKLTQQGDSIYLDNKYIKNYCFQKNYYFMAGDKPLNSHDSRYWGLLPEEFIAGKAWVIWKSVDDETGKIRFSRTFKFVK